MTDLLQTLARLPEDGIDSWTGRQKRNGSLVRTHQSGPGTPVTEPYEYRQIIQLGHYGDLVNILPIAKHQSELIGRPVKIVCERNYADLLDGVSYAEAVISPSASILDLRTEGPGILNTHAGGPEKSTLPYNLQAWEQVGYADRFYELKPVFDLRSSIREIALVEDHITFERPVLLYTLTGNSSAIQPEISTELRRLIHDSFGDTFQVIDLGGIKAYRIYDLLGLFDKAAALITIDTSALHFATASDIPVVALLSNHTPIYWRASATKGNVIFKTGYSEAVAAWPKIVKAVRARYRTVALPKQPIVHVVPHTGIVSGETKRRYDFAAASWKAMYEDGVLGVWLTEENAKRCFDCGEGRSVPYLKDALALGLAASNDNDDIICLTNADIPLTPGFHKALRCRMAVHSWCSSFRLEFGQGDEHLMLERKGKKSLGRDMFAFKRGWLARNFDAIPDFLLGVGGWDYALAMWYRRLMGRVVSDCKVADCLPETEMSYGFVWHEAHRSSWTFRTGGWDRAREHNRVLVHDFFEKIGMEEAHKDIR